VRWILESTDSAAALAEALNLTAPAARVLAARGFRDPESARRFLKPTLADLHDPDLLKSMPEAVSRD
jgi:single-stranded-DNA-specific exonuclease